ncbi:MAG: hypothetical protein ABDH37_02380 [Candidatus Hydrothermales bacterium]
MKKLILIISIALIATKCKGPKGEKGPPGPINIYVLGFVEHHKYNDTSEAEVEVSFSPSIPDVKINDIDIPIYYFYGSSFSFYKDNITTLSSGTNLNLKVTYKKSDGNQGEAIATAKIPGIFGITSPYPEASIPVGGSLNVVWSQSLNANFYFANLYLYYEYIDLVGNHSRFSCDVETTLTQTSITFPPSVLFPDLNEIDSIYYSIGYFYVLGINGPKLEYGEMGNVEGDGSGFFWGVMLGDEIYVYISGTELITIQKPSPSEKLRSYLKNKCLSFKIKD